MHLNFKHPPETPFGTKAKTKPMQTRRFGRTRKLRTNKRRGLAIVWLALTMVVFMGVAALSVDQGFHLSQRARAQKAADAAALAAAFQMARSLPNSAMTASAVEYAGFNGYTISPTPAPSATGVPPRQTTVQVLHPIDAVKKADGTSLYKQPDGTPYPSNYVMVRVMREEPRFFGSTFLKMMLTAAQINEPNPALRAVRDRFIHSQMVGAKAVARFDKFVPLDINGGGIYGLNDGPVTLAVFGPDGLYSNGDFRSSSKLNNGSPNPDYIADNPNDKDQDSGYNFEVSIPNTSAFNWSKIEIFDPDCWNVGGRTDAVPGISVDELRGPQSSTAGGAVATTTRYRLYADNTTPDKYEDDIFVGEVSYGGSFVDSNGDGKHDTDMQWTRFDFPRSSYSGQNFRINVLSTAGASENGFNLRAGRPGDTVTYNAQGQVTRNDFAGGPTSSIQPNGTVITAEGYIPINFNKDTAQTVKLGFVPAGATEIAIQKFDTDVGAQTVTYTCDSLPGQSFTGVLSGNGEFKTDRYPLPAGYTGGNWSASYKAGLQDTSVWSMSYSGTGPGRAGPIRLVE